MANGADVALLSKYLIASSSIIPPVVFLQKSLNEPVKKKEAQSLGSPALVYTSTYDSKAFVAQGDEKNTPRSDISFGGISACVDSATSMEKRLPRTQLQPLVQVV